MKFWPVNFFDNAASRFVRFYLSSKLKFRFSQHKGFRFCIDHQFLLKGGKPFAMFWIYILCERKVEPHFFSICFAYALSLSLSLSLFYVSLSLFLSLAVSLPLFLWFTTVLVRYFSVYEKLWKISNLKIFLRNKEELKEWKYKIHAHKENDWKEFLKGWMSLAWFWPEKSSTEPSKWGRSWKFGRAL